MKQVALTIAGSDPSGGAGLQADIRTFQEIGVYGTSVVTLLTVQNSKRVDSVEVCEADLVTSQLQSLLEDISPHAVKTGALGSEQIISHVAKQLRVTSIPLVIDPVSLSSSGATLLSEDAHQTLVRELFPLAELVTPNINEASALSGVSIQSVEDMREAARRISKLCKGNVLITGGHLERSEQLTDVLLLDGELYLFEDERISIPTEDVHGTGCVLSAAITAYLALGQPIVKAVDSARQFVRGAISQSTILGTGSALMTLKT